MPKQRSAPNREVRIFDSWLDEPGPYIDLTTTEDLRLRSELAPTRRHRGTEIADANTKD